MRRSDPHHCTKGRYISTGLSCRLNDVSGRVFRTRSHAYSNNISKENFGTNCRVFQNNNLIPSLCWLGTFHPHKGDAACVSELSFPCSFIEWETMEMKLGSLAFCSRPNCSSWNSAFSGVGLILSKTNFGRNREDI